MLIWDFLWSHWIRLTIYQQSRKRIAFLFFFKYHISNQSTLCSLKDRHILPQFTNKEHMAPSSILFSQNDISPKLTRGDSLHGIIDEIKSDERSIMDFLPMQVANVGGKCYTENNRTLYICRVLECEKMISTVEVENVSIYYYSVNLWIISCKNYYQIF